MSEDGCALACLLVCGERFGDAACDADTMLGVVSAANVP